MELSITHSSGNCSVFERLWYDDHYIVEVFLAFTEIEVMIIKQRNLHNLFVMKLQQFEPHRGDREQKKGLGATTISLQSLYAKSTYLFENALEPQAFEADLRTALARVQQQIYAAERDHSTPVQPKEKMPIEKVLAIWAAVIVGILTLPWTISPIIVIFVNLTFGLLFRPILGPLLILAALLWPFGHWCYRAYMDSQARQERLARKETEQLRTSASRNNAAPVVQMIVTDVRKRRDDH